MNRSWAEIDLAALERNLRLIRKALPSGVRYVAVVKADAYGHGIHPTAARLMQSGVDLFAVANVREATEIREMGSGWPILVLGPLLPEEDETLATHDLIATISSAEELDRLTEVAESSGKTLPIHLKIDTGMGRLGAWWESAADLLRDARSRSKLDLQGALTHFADPADPDFTQRQREIFLGILREENLLGQPDFLVHADNSSSLRALSKSDPCNAVRIGLLQFGVSPPAGSPLADLLVEPVFSFHTRLALVKELPAGATVSYGRQHRLERDSRVGLLSAGYGDAIPLTCGGRAHVLVQGRRHPIIGRVTMDQTLIDLTDASEHLQPGENVTLIGRQGEESITLSELANHADTIPWEILCSVTKRVPRVYKTTRE
ncbi:MAG: alanine racemase [Opitutales bacterium]|nr:alanine racemase [Opitutales bacterium]